MFISLLSPSENKIIVFINYIQNMKPQFLKQNNNIDVFII